MQKLLLKFMLLFVGVRQKECRSLLDQAKNGSPFDVIIVPGMPFKKGAWMKAVKARIYWAKYLLENGITKKIMFSGGAVYTEYIEAESMKLYAIAVGIPENVILTEPKAEHSTQNLYYSYHECVKLGYHRMAMATDPFQAKMMDGFIKTQLPELGCLPFVLKVIDEIDPFMIEPQLDCEEAIAPNFISVKERENRKTRMDGTKGKNIQALYLKAYPAAKNEA
jgi:hypothetical protein